MLKRIWKGISSLFQRFKKKLKPDRRYNHKSETYSAEKGTLLHDAHKPNVQSKPETVFLTSRILALTSHLPPYRKKDPNIKRMRVHNFIDAYRFFIRICAKPDMPIHRKAGRTYYKATWPELKSDIILTEYNGTNNKIIAIMRVSIPGFTTIREIRFIKSSF